MTKTLVKLGKGLELDIDKLIAGRLLIQANSGGGKSYTVRVLAEATFGHVQHIILDVDGEYHTLRENHDYMLFGKEGDYPADIRSAALLARRLLETKVSAIIDLYELGQQKALFIQRFLVALVNVPRELWHPVLVFVDEAHAYAPENGSAISRNAVIDLMTLGRKRGFTGILATQRIAKLSKDAAAECNNKLIGRSSLDVDMKRSADEIGLTSREEIRSLRKLTEGQFYAIGAAFENANDSDLIQIGKAKTTHLSAGQTRSARPAPPSAKIKKKFEQFADLPAESDEELKTLEDYKAKIKSLTTQLATKPKALAVVPPVKTLEREIITGAQLKTIDKLVTRVDKSIDRALELSNKSLTSSELVNGEVKKLVDVADKLKSLKIVGASMMPTNHKADAQAAKAVAKLAATRTVTKLAPQPQAAKSDPPLKGGLAKILECLIQHGANGCTSKQLAVLTGYKQTSRYEFSRQLVASRLAEYRGDNLIATDAGRAALPNVAALPSGDELRELWMNKLDGGELQIFKILVESYPDDVQAQQISETTNYKQTSIYEFGRKLIARQLATKNRGGALRASETLYG